jgi:type II secretory pathway pseudopilin PulG
MSEREKKKEGKRIALGIAFTVLVLASIIASVVFLNAQNKQILEKNLNLNVRIANTLTLTVHRANGKVETYVKEGDPWERNFFYLIVNSFFGRYYISPYTIYKTDGSTFTQPDWEDIGTSSTSYYPMLAIGIGSGTVSFSPYDYELSVLVQRANVTSANFVFNDNGTHIVETASASFTASSAVTISEVGLYWEGFVFNGGYKYIYVLIARDLITAISLAVGDAVTVTYTITVPYNQAPMLKNLAALIADYILCAKYYGKTVSFTTLSGTVASAMDIGYDYYSFATDNVKEYDYVYIGSGDPIYRTTLSSLYSQVAITTSYVTISLSVNSTHAVINLPTVAVTVPSATVIKEVGLVIDSTDIDGSINTNAQKLLILYFPLSNPISVPAGSGVKFTFTITFPLGGS